MTVSTQVASYTAVIIRGAIFNPTFSFTDENGDPEPLTSASFDVTPNGDSAFSWDQGNGKFVNVSTGVYQLDLTEADTAALTWDSGTYRISTVDGSGESNPCIIEGLIFVNDC